MTVVFGGWRIGLRPSPALRRLEQRIPSHRIVGRRSRPARISRPRGKARFGRCRLWLAALASQTSYQPRRLPRAFWTARRGRFSTPPPVGWRGIRHLTLQFMLALGLCRLSAGLRVVLAPPCARRFCLTDRFGWHSR